MWGSRHIEISMSTVGLQRRTRWILSCFSVAELSHSFSLRGGSHPRFHICSHVFSVAWYTVMFHPGAQSSRP
jgi:hypothetical protein